MRLPGIQKSPRQPVVDSTKPDGVDVDDLDEVDEGNKNIILSIIKQLGHNTDLSRITLPTFILERKSMLERITNLMQHPRDLISAAEEPNAEKRFVHVIRWYMSGWHIAPKAVKKPLNPVLGEYFSSYWDLENGSRAYYVAEQTSHHPPKSSYFYSVPSHGIRIDGLLLPRSRFLGNSAAALMEGVGELHFEDHHEVYRVTQPNTYARGVLLGNLKLEIGDHAIVECPDSGMHATIEFKVKGWVSGTYHAIGGIIKNKQNEELYELSGKWNEVMYIKDLRTGEKTVFFDTAKDHPMPPKVRPLEEQGEYESRRLWRPTIIALGQRNHEVATDEKYKVEQEQREFAKAREDAGQQFQPKLFIPVKNELQFQFLRSKEIARHPEKAHELIASVMPVLPGDKFPDNFESPYSVKETPQQKKEIAEHPNEGFATLPVDVNTSYVLTDDEGDEFVDAQ